MTYYRQFMWIDEEEGFIAFDVKNAENDAHEYYEYIKFFTEKYLAKNQHDEMD